MGGPWRDVQSGLVCTSCGREASPAAAGSATLWFPSLASPEFAGMIPTSDRCCSPKQQWWGSLELAPTLGADRLRRLSGTSFGSSVLRCVGPAPTAFSIILGTGRESSSGDGITWRCCSAAPIAWPREDRHPRLPSGAWKFQNETAGRSHGGKLSVLSVTLRLRVRTDSRR